MQILSIFRKHERYALLATAYADGELATAERSRFENHLSSCAECAERVESAKAVKAAIASLPAISPSRSFRLTPAMVSQIAPQPQRVEIPKRVPMYLALARVAAGLAVFTFVSVFAVSLLDGSSSDQRAADGQFTSGAGSPLSDTAAGAESAPNATDKSAAATPAPGLAPATGGAVEGQGFASPVAASPVPPERNSADAPTSGGSSGVNETTGQPGVLDDPAVIAYGVDASESGGGRFPWVIVLGSIAGATVGLLYVLEANRRKRA